MLIFRTLVWLLRLKPNGSMTEKFNWALLLDNVLSHSKNMVPYYRAHAGGAQFKATLLTEHDKQKH